MADLLTVSALTFTAAYLFLRNDPAPARPKETQPKALKNTEQVMTTNIRNRMGDAIGNGTVIGVTREQMGHVQRDAEADVHLGGPLLKPTRPPSTLAILGSPALNTKLKDAPGTPSHALPITDAHARNDRTADTVARAERARKLFANASKTVTIGPAKRMNLEHVQTMSRPWLATNRPTRSIHEAERIVDLPAHILSHNANVRLQQMRTVSAEPGDMVRLQALASAV